MLADFDAPRTERVVNRAFHRGVLHGHEAVAVVAGIGKTAVATTTTLLVQHFGVQCRRAHRSGRPACPQELSIGDVVVATHLVHHDLDASPIFPALSRAHARHGEARDGRGRQLARLRTRPSASSRTRRGGTAKVARGLVLSGDQFMDAVADRRPARALPRRAGGRDGGRGGRPGVHRSRDPVRGRALDQRRRERGRRSSVPRTSECGRYASGIIGRLLRAMR